MKRRRPPDDYAVGYRKPPVEHRFKAGESGNPRGRPKGTKNVRTDLAEELRETVIVREGQRQRRVTKQRALFKGLLARAMHGDVRASTAVIAMIVRLIEGVEEGQDTPLTEDEAELLDNFVERLNAWRAQRGSGSADGGSGTGGSEGEVP